MQYRKEKDDTIIIDGEDIPRRCNPYLMEYQIKQQKVEIESLKRFIASKNLMYEYLEYERMSQRSEENEDERDFKKNLREAREKMRRRREK